MSDSCLRELERRWRESRTTVDEGAWLRELVRVGRLSRAQLALAAALEAGAGGARLALGEEAPAQIETTDLHPGSLLDEGNRLLQMARAAGPDVLVAVGLVVCEQLEAVWLTAYPLDRSFALAREAGRAWWACPCARHERAFVEALGQAGVEAEDSSATSSEDSPSPEQSAAQSRAVQAMCALNEFADALETRLPLDVGQVLRRAAWAFGTDVPAPGYPMGIDHERVLAVLRENLPRLLKEPRQRDSAQSEAQLLMLEREWRRTRTPASERAWLSARRAAGDLPRWKLELAALCGHQPARSLIGAFRISPTLPWVAEGDPNVVRVLQPEQSLSRLAEWGWWVDDPADETQPPRRLVRGRPKDRLVRLAVDLSHFNSKQVAQQAGYALGQAVLRSERTRRNMEESLKSGLGGMGNIQGVSELRAVLLGRQRFGVVTHPDNWNEGSGVPPGAVARCMRAVEFLSMADSAKWAHELFGVLADEARQVPTGGEDFYATTCDALIRWAVGCWLPNPKSGWIGDATVEGEAESS